MEASPANPSEPHTNPLLRKWHKIPVRAWIVALIFMTSCMNAGLNHNVAFILPHMIVHKPLEPVPHCSKTKNGSLFRTRFIQNYGPRYNWSEKALWQIQAAYYYGIAIASPPAGILAEWLGPKTTICFSLIFSSMINLLNGLGAHWGWGVAFICRFVVGLASGTIYPALQCFVGRWAPPNEKGKFVNAIMGDYIGLAVFWVSMRYILAALGWQWTFYILSGIVALYCPIFWILAANHPEYHMFISKEEIAYIRTAQKGSVSLTKAIPPYKEILSSSYCWALTILNVGSMWGVQVQLLLVHEYVESYIGLHRDESFLIGILPLITQFCSGILVGNLTDFIRAKDMLPQTIMTKICVIFSHIIPAFILMAMGSIDCNPAMATLLLILKNICAGATVGANMRTPTDLSPNFAGTIFGINMSLSLMTGFVVPSTAKYILGFHSGKIGWAMIFLISGGFYLTTGSIFIWFGSAEMQPWNDKK